MTQIIIYAFLAFIMILLIYKLTIASTQEHFYASSCEDLNKDGLICSIPNSPLFSNKCYKVKQTTQNQDGEYEHINVDFCTDYPECKEIGERCDASNIAKLANGYVERW